MAVQSREIGAVSGGRQVPGNKIGAFIIWSIGCYMTYQFMDQITEMDAGTLMFLAIALQLVLTIGQSPVWRGRGSMISYTALVVDAVVNFGGVMFFIANIDDAGSVQALTGSLVGYAGEWPLFVKGLLALFFSGIIAGLPEFLWKLD